MATTLRKRRLKRLYDYIKSLRSRRIDMGNWQDPSAEEAKSATDCGTSCCAGGHSVTLYPRELRFEDGKITHRAFSGLGPYTSLGKVYGLDFNQAFNLFFVPNDKQEWLAACRTILES